jgi:hypothetical protein
MCEQNALAKCEAFFAETINTKPKKRKEKKEKEKSKSKHCRPRVGLIIILTEKTSW